MHRGIAISHFDVSLFSSPKRTVRHPKRQGGQTEVHMVLIDHLPFTPEPARCTHSKVTLSTQHCTLNTHARLLTRHLCAPPGDS